MNLESQVQALNAFANNLSKATSVREKVRLADRIFGTLGECEKLVEEFIVSEMAGSCGGGTLRTRSNARQPGEPEQNRRHPQAHEKNFSEMKLADIARSLLKENGVMHGRDIEAAAKSGGFKSVSENFQSYLAVALKRDGGFENLGKNRWQLSGIGSDKAFVSPESSGKGAS